ncbi:MAG: glycosyltransferase family 4 protein [Xenococcaceae cyanobacterium MO_188.B29]|nr:glycosyltransferase family 4 protein [Xenococcaceae cyanobacterium MO_188.B29]
MNYSDANKLKILQINHSDTIGGAGIAAYRLHQGLRRLSVDSRLLVSRKQTQDKLVANIPRKTNLESRISPLTKFLGLNYLQYIGSFDIPKISSFQEADILNFHNLHTGYFSYLSLPTLTKYKPAVWTLHDQWAFTGHCAYSYDCDRWKIGCGKCPYPNSYPAIKRDNTRLEWKLKNWAYNSANLTIVAPSKWLAERAKESMLNRFSIHHISNGIDTEIYQPLDSEYCKVILGISKNQNVLMLGANNLKDYRKGGDLLQKALSSLPASLKADSVLITMGRKGEEISKAVEIDTINLGYIESERIKALVYSAVDLFLFPTRADNLPLMLQESMACGTPMVSFNIGGVSDLVRPEATGYLAKSENIDDFSKGIIALLEDKSLRERFSQNCREIAIEEFSLEKQAQKYVDIYRQILQD